GRAGRALHRELRRRRRGPHQRRDHARPGGGGLRGLRRRQHLHRADRARPAPGHPHHRARLGRGCRAQAPARRRRSRHLALQDLGLGDGPAGPAPAGRRCAEGRRLPNGRDRGLSVLPGRGQDHRADPRRRRGGGRAPPRRSARAPAGAVIGDRGRPAAGRDRAAGVPRTARDGVRAGGHGAQRMSTASLADLRSAVIQAGASLASNGAAGSASGVKVERPKRDGQGDYSTNLAMLLAPALRKAPREIAEQVGSALTEALASDLVRFEVAGPGFVNLFLSDDWYRRALRTVLDAGERFGAGGAPVTQQVLVEFVSANPTGPLVAASGRHAAYGDALSRVLAHHGHEVWREYYFNDAGGQIERLGQSVLARARGEDPPEDGYQGEYVIDLADEIPGVGSMDAGEAAAHAVELLLAQIKATLERYGVHFDQYFSERTLHEGSPSYLDRALEVVAQGGHSYESEGALWLRSTTFGDDKDR